MRKFGLKLHEEKGTINYIEEATERLNKVFVSSTTDTSDKFIAAGMYNTQYASLVQPIKYLVAIIGGGAIAYAGFRLNWKMMDYILYESIWLVLVIILPDMYLRQRSVALQHKISNKLPYLLDLMGVCVQTGMTIESSMGYLGKEMANFDKDLAYMLKKTNDRARLVGLEIALQELYERVPTPEVRSFVMTLNQSLQYGSSIYGVLTTLATDIREVQMLGLEEKIGKLAAKMSVPLILFIMLPIVILITAPGIMRMLS
ncbi:type II secretion system F family protein [Vibrio sp. SCSIO 43136]|uniref:type II secretion system F family protein n=1 Tax=Vibrio sp. SCSIO 43136 TaxID=2819101 RepID=UPI0020765D7E|nr:type II secretion system F family protein [Vibrio sp. SCSIO 43136]